MISSVVSMIGDFNTENIKILKQLGYEIHVIASFSYKNISNEKLNKYLDFFHQNNVILHDVNINRNPFDIQNIKAFKKIKTIIRKEQFQIIHCHSPIGGVLARIAAIPSRKKGTKVIYTAHGFHFFRNGSKKDWLLYYPVEKFLSRFTDTLITINAEDYKVAEKFYTKKLKYIPGVGLDTFKFEHVNVDFKEKRSVFGIEETDFVILSVGELSDRKNHEVIIRAIHKIGKKDIHYLICGQGSKKEDLEELILQLNLENQVKLLGYRTDIDEINAITDIFAFPSKREGLGIAALEAMSVGLPILTSNVQGIPDYSINGVTGYNYNPMDMDGFADGIMNLYNDRKSAKSIGEHNKVAVKKYDIQNVNKIMSRIYSEA